MHKMDACLRDEVVGTIPGLQLVHTRGCLITISSSNVKLYALYAFQVDEKIFESLFG